MIEIGYNFLKKDLIKIQQGLEPYSSFFPAVFGQTVSRCST